jgi:hypothetical protein
VLALGLVIKGGVGLKERIIFARSLKAAGFEEIGGVDLQLITRKFQEGQLDINVLREAFEIEPGEAAGVRRWWRWSRGARREQGRKRRILREAWRVIVWRGHAQHKTK